MIPGSNEQRQRTVWGLRWEKEEAKITEEDMQESRKLFPARPEPGLQIFICF